MKQNYFNLFDNILKNLKEIENYLTDMKKPFLKGTFSKHKPSDDSSSKDEE